MMSVEYFKIFQPSPLQHSNNKKSRKESVGYLVICNSLFSTFVHVRKRKCPGLRCEYEQIVDLSPFLGS